MNRLFVSWTIVTVILLIAAVEALGQSEPSSLPEPARDGDFQHPDEDRVALGQMLFFDKELSGNRNISCATCHSPVVATVDGLSTNIGTGGRGLAVLRDAGNYPDTTLFDPQSRGARNMTPLFNLGHSQFQKLFWDGRIQVDPTIPQGFATPAGANLPFGFDNALEALSIFAQTDLQEMTGQPGTNELAGASEISPHVAVWEALMLRLGDIAEYVNLFTAAFPEVGNHPENMSIVHVGKALGAFQAVAFRSDNSPFDRFLRGDEKAMSQSAKKGMRLFYGNAGCSDCHSGVFQTDHDFHAIGMPQIGPGFGDGANGHEDFGREGFTGDMNDRYRFRTPSLRNVYLTGPWGHDGCFNSVRNAVLHHFDPLASLANADACQMVMPPRPDLDELDLIALNDPLTTQAIGAAVEINLPELSEQDLEYVLDFLQALTDPSAMDLRKTVPVRVPSGLPLAEIR